MDLNLEAENTFLGCILKDNTLIKETSLQEKHLSDGANKILFKAFRAIESESEPIDTVSVLTNLGKARFESVGGKTTIANLINSVASLEPFKTYEKYILENWKIAEAQKITGMKIHSLEDLNKVKDKLSNLEIENNDKDYDHQKSLQEMYRQIENQGEGLSGHDTGFTDLNNMLDGFQNKDLIISAARPSVGKTAKMLNHSERHCAKGGITAIFSLEMGEQQLNKRLISTIGRIDGHKMRNPKQYFNDDDWSKFHVALGLLGNMNIHIYDQAGQTVSYIRSKVKALRRQYPDVPMLIQIDYLQLIRPDGVFFSKNEEVGEITRSLKELAKEADAPVYLLSQLSRGVEQRQDKRPMMADLRDSGSIEQDADVIEFLYRDDYYNADSSKKNIIEVIIAKQRNGSVGTVELAYRKEYNLFLDLDKRSGS